MRWCAVNACALVSFQLDTPKLLCRAFCCHHVCRRLVGLVKDAAICWLDGGCCCHLLQARLGLSKSSANYRQVENMRISKGSFVNDLCAWPQVGELPDIRRLRKKAFKKVRLLCAQKKLVPAKMWGEIEQSNEQGPEVHLQWGWASVAAVSKARALWRYGVRRFLDLLRLKSRVVFSN